MYDINSLLYGILVQRLDERWLDVFKVPDYT
jgi:hypothetical protein